MKPLYIPKTKRSATFPTSYGPEEQLQAQCVDWLRAQCPRVFFFHVPNGLYLGSGKNKAGYINKMKRLGFVPGVPDIYMAWPGCDLFVELKAKGNTPKPHQKAIIERLRGMGHPAEVIDTFEDFRDLCRFHGVPGAV